MKRMLLGFALVLAAAGVAWSGTELGKRPDPRQKALERAALALGFDDAQRAAAEKEIAKLPLEACRERLLGARGALLSAAAQGADELSRAGEALIDDLAAQEDAFLVPLLAIYGTLNETQRRIVAGHLERGPHAGPPPPHEMESGPDGPGGDGACAGPPARHGLGEGRHGMRAGKMHGRRGPFTAPGMRGLLGPQLFAGLHPDPAAMKALAAKVRDGSLQEADARAALEAWRAKAKAALPAVAAKAAEAFAKIPDDAKEKMRQRMERFAAKAKEEKKEAAPAPASGKGN